MKRVVLVIVAVPSIIVVFSVNSCRALTNSSAFGTFVGTSLCADIAKPLLNIPPGASCDRIKWNLILNSDARSQMPTTYELNAEYGFHVDNRTFVTSASIQVMGRWRVVNGSRKDPTEVVVQLDPGRSQTISFVMLDDNLLHLLDKDQSLMVGSAAQSYTLSRREESKRAMTLVSRSVSPNSPANVEVFTGRTPCSEFRKVLTETVGPDCQKMKWELSLYRDAKTLVPTTYKIRGTVYRERIREGKWTIVAGPKNNPRAVIFQLDPDKTSGSISLFQADNNVLFFLNKEGNLMVGNRDFSYTLNREVHRAAQLEGLSNPRKMP